MSVEVTEQLLEDVWRSWLEMLHDYTAPQSVKANGEYKHGGFVSDDGFDYLMAVIDGTRLFTELWFDSDIARCQAIFDTPGVFDACYAERPGLLAELDIPANAELDGEGYDGPYVEDIHDGPYVEDILAATPHTPPMRTDLPLMRKTVQ